MSCLPLPVLQRASAGIVGIFHRPERLLGCLNWGATVIVVDDYPDELFTFEMRAPDHEAIERSDWLRAWSFLRHDRYMTAILALDKRLPRETTAPAYNRRAVV
jgi:hypothetical protein